MEHNCFFFVVELVENVIFVGYTLMVMVFGIYIKGALAAASLWIFQMMVA